MKALIYAEASGKPKEEALNAEQKERAGNGAHASVRGRRRDRRRAAREVSRQGRAGRRRVARGAARGHHRGQAHAGALRLGAQEYRHRAAARRRSTRSCPAPNERPARQGFAGANSEPVERAPDPAAPFSAFVFKTLIDPFAGKLSIFRVVSGRAQSDATVLNSTRGVARALRPAAAAGGQEAIADRRPRCRARSSRSPSSRTPPPATRYATKNPPVIFPAARAAERRSSLLRFGPRPRATNKNLRRRCSTWSKRTARSRPIAIRRPTRSSCRARARCISRSRSRSSNVNLM